MEPEYERMLDSRSKAQRLMLDLLLFIKGQENELEHDEFRRSVFVLLVGTAFSLWRAAFLYDASREWSGILKAAKEVLDKLLRDNTFLYSNEWQFREWTGGFFLNSNSARFRIARAIERWSQLNEPTNQTLQRFKELDKAGIEHREPEESWDTIYFATLEIFQRLKGN